MGHIYADVELINLEDMLLSKKHIIGAEEVKRMNIRILVDTGAYMLTVNESIQQQLQLPIVEKRKSHSCRRAHIGMRRSWPYRVKI